MDYSNEARSTHDCPHVDADGCDAVHKWFGLSYAPYLTLPRSVLQSMPGEWQKRMVALLRELQIRCSEAGIECPETEVQIRSEAGRVLPNPLDYRHGQRDVFKK